MRQIGWYKRQIRRWILVLGFAAGVVLGLCGIIGQGWESAYLAGCCLVGITLTLRYV